MQLILLARYWAQITIAILCLLLLFAVSSCSSKEREIKLLISEHQLVISQKDLAHANEQRAAQAKAAEQNIKAANEYQAREQIILADVASARDSVVSLSKTLDKVSATAAADAEFRGAALRVTSESLQECSSEYSKMGEIADRLSNSLRATIDANKR